MRKHELNDDARTDERIQSDERDRDLFEPSPSGGYAVVNRLMEVAL